MWEALMMLRLIASAAPPFTPGRRVPQPALARRTLKGAIRLSFAGYRLSLRTPSPNFEKRTENRINRISMKISISVDRAEGAHLRSARALGLLARIGILMPAGVAAAHSAPFVERSWPRKRSAT
ncbi:MAG: hypothetical protein EOR67_08820 [Mesorhizobium sp.]|nr:MAG: hypothetical protein EOR69_03780 [Mesorhizobium sp.]RWL89514.1 MAG: hypothetical protein EOR67_08820 [Mesorhizobium sp.]RWM01542.1 MAG: hypothetical protein EOR70_07130 [Mesorhizobium sp.]